ncbi:MAG: DUF4145 domain-containing protein [Streptosporangiales bacterium]|nr:DUF4145 domain-containing protein [Streptosporangiales bacterium]
MSTDGLVDPRLLEWAQELRALRNQGAHFTDVPVSREESRDALELCEAILDYMYVLSARFKEFRSRRSGPGSGPHLPRSVGQ